MKDSKQLFKLIAPLFALLIGCAKEKPYDIEYKEVKLLEKDNIVTEETIIMKNGKKVSRPVEYLYVPMTLGTPMNVTDADPFYQGQEKVVRLSWSEEGLDILEIERDARFQDNDLNEYPVLTIPGDYKAFRCQEDAYGDCTHKEEENDDLEWYQKTSFLPKFEEIKKREVNELDIFTLNDGSCLSEEGKKVVDYEMSKGVINIELETIYKVNKSNFFCFFRSFYDNQLKTNGFRVREYYSLVRLDSLISEDYQPIAYPEPDHGTFGFFTREEEVLDNHYDRQRKVRNILMERWNPKRKNNALVYHLSPEYSKPENAFILKATKEAVATMNKEMAQVNVPFQLVLVEQPDPKKAVSVGDLRYNSLVLIEDPLANGLLGYGPAVSNPYTGEILKAHTNMYLGVLKSQTRWIYQAAVDLTEKKYKEEKEDSQEDKKMHLMKIRPQAIDNLPSALVRGYFPQMIQEELNEFVQSIAREEQEDDDTEDEDSSGTSLSEIDLKRLKTKLPPEEHIHSHQRETFSHERINRLMNERIHKKKDLKAAILLKKLKEEGSLTKERETLLKEEARLDRYAENNALAVEFFPIGGTSKVIYPELLAVSGIQTERGTLKPWTQLSEAQKSAVEKIVVTSSYKATLIHELGHNLGLRHNFMGSWDKENFYTDEEARELGMEAAPAYSSIMDYSFSEFNQLKAFGKYDLAALRFGYAREVEVEKNGKIEIKEIKGTMSDFENSLPSDTKRKSYQFCTDENAGLSSLCNRFDEGTTLVEVTKHLIERYQDSYKYRNFRDGRLDFSSYNLPGYIFARKREFTRIRDVLEEYEFFVEIFGAGIMTQGCSPSLEIQNPSICARIQDRRDAVKAAGEFFIEILLTPDHICALTKEGDDDTIVEYRKLADIYDEIKYSIDHVTTSCFDDAVIKRLASPMQGETALKVVGETGKFFNAFKDTDPNYKYITDRFVLGVWPDKIMAIDALFKRTWGKSNTDRGHMSLIDIPSIRENAQPILEHFAMGKPLQLFIPFKGAKNSQFLAPYAIGSDYTVSPIEDTFSWLRDYLGLPQDGGRGDFVTTAFKQTRTGVDYGVEYEDMAFETRNLMAVIKTEGFVPLQNRNPDEIHFFDSRSRVTFSANDFTPVAKKMISAITNFDLLNEAGRKEALFVFFQKTQKPAAPQELTGADKIFWEKVSFEVMDALISVGERGNPLHEPSILKAFGEVTGTAIIQVFAKGVDHIKMIKEEIVRLQSTPNPKLSDAGKKLYQLDPSLLDQYSKKMLDEEVIEYYKTQLKKMPNFLRAPIR